LGFFPPDPWVLGDEAGLFNLLFSRLTCLILSPQFAGHFSYEAQACFGVYSPLPHTHTEQNKNSNKRFSVSDTNGNSALYIKFGMDLLFTITVVARALQNTEC
jgi:hypothetical protein